jgi:HEAT repeat protein
MPLRAPLARRRVARRAACFALAAVLLPALGAAQIPGDTDPPRTRLRDRYRTPQTTQKLSDNVRKLQSEDPAERLEAIHGLGELNEPKAIEYLVGAANDPDMRIRIKAIDTLGQIKAKDSIPLLVQQLFMRDTDLGTKRRILVSLGKIGDDRATRPIIDFLSRDVDPSARGNAIFALGDIGDPAAITPLEAIANDGDPGLRGLAAEAVRKIRARPAPSVVPPALAVDRRGGPPQPPSQ